MRAKKLEELQVWQRARALVGATSALAAACAVNKDFELRAQLSGAAASVLANIGEGFGQATDRAFAKYLYIARGSANEMRCHVEVAIARGYATTAECMELVNEATEISKMISGLIRYLLRCDWKDRC